MSTPPLVNATPVEVEHLDGSKETVQLARLTIRQLYAWSKHLAANEGPELVQLCAGRPAEWIDTLTPAAFAALHRACIDANFPAASEVAKGDPRLAAKLLPFVQDVQMIMILGTGAMLGLDLRSVSSAPAPSASAEATGSESSTSHPTGSSPSSPPANA